MHRQPRVATAKKKRSEPRPPQVTCCSQIVPEDHDSTDTLAASKIIVQRRYEAVLGQSRSSEEARHGECTQRQQFMHPEQSFHKLAPPLHKPVLVVVAPSRPSRTSKQHELFYLKHLKDTTK